MDKLIEALQILRKYGNPEWPTHCEHDELHVLVDANLVSKEDIIKLHELHFFITDEWGTSHFKSYHYGSA